MADSLGNPNGCNKYRNHFDEMICETFRDFDEYSQNKVAQDHSWRSFYEIEKAAEQCKFEMSNILASYTTSILEEIEKLEIASKKANF